MRVTLQLPLCGVVDHVLGESLPRRPTQRSELRVKPAHARRERFGILQAFAAATEVTWCESGNG